MENYFIFIKSSFQKANENSFSKGAFWSQTTITTALYQTFFNSLTWSE